MRGKLDLSMLTVVLVVVVLVLTIVLVYKQSEGFEAHPSTGAVQNPGAGTGGGVGGPPDCSVPFEQLTGEQAKECHRSAQAIYRAVQSTQGRGHSGGPPGGQHAGAGTGGGVGGPQGGPQGGP